MNKPIITKIDKGKEPTLKEMQKIVGGYIEIAYDDGKTQIICNEEGKMIGLPINQEATNIWNKLLGKFNSNPNYIHSDVLVGDVLILYGEARIK